MVNSQAVSRAVGSFGRATKCAAIEKQSIIVRMLPTEGGSPMMKSSEICDHGWPGVGRGYSSPASSQLGSLFWAQVEQAVKYLQVSLGRVGHQK